jgi:hypothetical protein
MLGAIVSDVSRARLRRIFCDSKADGRSGRPGECQRRERCLVWQALLSFTERWTLTTS